MNIKKYWLKAAILFWTNDWNLELAEFIPRREILWSNTSELILRNYYCFNNYQIICAYCLIWTYLIMLHELTFPKALIKHVWANKLFVRPETMLLTVDETSALPVQKMHQRCGYWSGFAIVAIVEGLLPNEDQHFKLSRLNIRLWSGVECIFLRKKESH